MNKLLLVPILVMSGCGYANAASTMDHFKEVIYKKPYSVEVCSDVSTSGDKTGDAIKGAIIGGLLGNNIKGEEHGGAAGAVIGAMLGHANSNATGGSKTVCKMETRYNE